MCLAFVEALSGKVGPNYQTWVGLEVLNIKWQLS